LDLEITFDSHPSEEVLEEYAFDRLPEAAKGTVEEHLLICVGCQESLSNVDQYIRLMKHSTARMPLQANGFSGPQTDARRMGAMVALMAASMAGATAVLAMMLATRHLAPSLTSDLVHLVALRGGDGDSMARTRSGGSLQLEIDLSDLPPSDTYRIELVNSYGQEAWSGGGASAGGKLSIHSLWELKTGVYWVRLYSNSGELLREFGLRAD
jgi:hypothetical protein